MAPCVSAAGMDPPGPTSAAPPRKGSGRGRLKVARTVRVATVHAHARHADRRRARSRLEAGVRSRAEAGAGQGGVLRAGQPGARRDVQMEAALPVAVGASALFPGLAAAQHHGDAGQGAALGVHGQPLQGLQGIGRRDHRLAFAGPAEAGPYQAARRRRARPGRPAREAVPRSWKPPSACTSAAAPRGPRTVQPVYPPPPGTPPRRAVAARCRRWR